jgi:hypothetical protein
MTHIHQVDVPNVNLDFQPYIRALQHQAQVNHVAAQRLKKQKNSD